MGGDEYITRMVVLDHLFNTIGNGIPIESLMEEYIPTEQEVEKAMKWATTKEAYLHKEEGEIHYTASLPGEPLKSDNFKIKPLVFTPYPNFQKTYSMVYDQDFKTLVEHDPEWFKEAIFFYEEIKKWFETNEAKYVHYFKGNQIDIANYRNRLKPMTPANIKTAHGIMLEGLDDESIRNFGRKLWLKQRAKIDNFIDETIEMLKEEQRNYQ